MVKAVKAAQLADLIRDYLAQWSSQDLFGYFFSITQVTLEPDFTKATAWIDVLRPEDEQKVMKELSRRLPSYQRKLQQTLQRRSVPHVEFRLDRQEQLSTRMDELLKGS